MDLSLKSPANKAPIEAIYDAEVESALAPLDAVVTSDILAGALRALAVVSDERCPDLPGVPTPGSLATTSTTGLRWDRGAGRNETNGSRRQP